ncbi:MAG: hypothetical protein ACXVKA_16405 [Acidimicrobiia bacterium]
MSRRLAERAAKLLARRGPTRRIFLQKTALVGSAIAVVPVDYLLRPGSAYAAICTCAGQGCTCGSLCCDGYTEFCCTMTGQNVCPPGTIAGGWWKADGSSYCNGPRYYVDCNAFGVAPWGCGCANGDCNNRKAGCTLFRYGQCNQQATVGRIACRVVSCDPNVLVQGNCTPTLAVDNSTANQNKPCLQATPKPKEVDMAQADYFITTVGTDTWWFYNGNSKRALRPGENQMLVDLGIVRFKEVKRIAPEILFSIPDFSPAAAAAGSP